MGRGRILHCISTMGGGGAERQCVYLVTELVRRGWHVDVALLDGGPNLGRLEASGARIHWLRGFHQFDPRLTWQLFWLIGRLKPQLVQTWMSVMDVQGGIACRARSVPWLICERGQGAWVPAMGYTLSRLRLAVTSGTSAVVCNSVCAVHTWDPYLPKRTPRYAIRNALPIAEIQHTPPVDTSERGTGAASKTVLAVGRFIRDKNWDILIRAMARVARRVPVTGVFCGTGRWDRPRIDRLIRQYGLEKVIVLPGYVDDVWARMKSADVCVSVSRREGCPNAVIEAMACGCPLVVSDIPPHRELLDDETAFFADPADPPHVAEAIVQVLTQPDKARRRAARAQARAEQWTPSTIAGQYEDVYRDLLSCGRP